MRSERRLRLKVWALLLGVFILGSVTGVALDGMYRSRVQAALRAPSIKDGDVYFHVLERELDLTSEQASEARVILDETRNDYRAVCAEVRPRYDTLREHARGRLRALLLPAQQQRFDSIVTQEDCNCPEKK